MNWKIYADLKRALNNPAENPDRVNFLFWTFIIDDARGTGKVGAFKPDKIHFAARLRGQIHFVNKAGRHIESIPEADWDVARDSLITQRLLPQYNDVEILKKGENKFLAVGYCGKRRVEGRGYNEAIARLNFIKGHILRAYQRDKYNLNY